MKRAYVWLLGVVLVVPVVATGDDGGEVTLSLDRVTAEDAVKALTESSGAIVRVVPPPGAQFDPNGLRATFHWEHVSVSRALRDVCAAYHLNCFRGQFGWELHDPNDPGLFGPSIPRTAEPAFDKEGVRVFVDRIVWSASRTSGPILHLDLRCSLASGDPAAIAGPVNVVARDDRGHLITCGGRDAFPSFVRGQNQTFPDEWSGSIEFPAADPEARKLEWLEGEFMTYRHFIHRAVRVPYTPGMTVQAGSFGEFAVEVEASRPEAAEGADKGESTVEVRLFGPPRGPQQPLMSGGASAALVGKSGKLYQGGSFGTGIRDAKRTGWLGRGTFRSPGEPVVSVLAEVHAFGQPISHSRFRLTDLALPALRKEPGKPPRAGVFRAAPDVARARQQLAANAGVCPGRGGAE